MHVRVTRGTVDPDRADEVVVLTEEIAEAMKKLPRLRSYQGGPRPHLDWADRAVFAALVQRLPRALRGRHLVTPGPVLRCIAAWSADDGPRPIGPDGHRSTTLWSRCWCGWRGRTRAGDT